MTSKTNNGRAASLPIWVIFLPLIDFALIIRYFMHGKNIALFNPKGYIASQQYGLMVFAIGILLMVALPAIFIAYFIAWKYRDTNTKLQHQPTANKKSIVYFFWAVPTTALVLLASVMWPATHKLVPQNVIAASTKPLTIQVISLRWKWLFLYPEQQIATENFVQIPVNTPITFEMTADETPMSSFWIPNLGGQLYTMTSHVNKLNLMASEIGDYHGSSAEINGAGFAGMKFTARASSDADFEQWVQQIKKSPDSLDKNNYQQMLKPSEYDPPKYFSSYDPYLYADVLLKYTGHGEHTHNL